MATGIAPNDLLATDLEIFNEIVARLPRLPRPLQPASEGPLLDHLRTT